jgi:amino-acid N-acetyltransferase
MSEVTLRPAASDDREYVEHLLAENDLPTADLDAAYGSLFVCESTDGEAVGVAGLEIEGDAGLLRSLAVEESARGEGYGGAICERLLERADAQNLDAVYLLTTTASSFFADRGFEEIERERVPDALRANSEFTDLCPTSATCMRTNRR